MSYIIIDAHAHLWEELRGNINDLTVTSIAGGRSLFLGEVRQMMPPYMVDGRNTVEMLISNMDYAGVSGTVITQEYIDGNQNEYLLKAKKSFPDRLKICGLAEFRTPEFLNSIRKIIESGFDGIKVPAQRLVDLSKRIYLTDDEFMEMFKEMEINNIFLSIDLADGDAQVSEIEEVIKECPDLKIAIGHFGMVNRPGWKSQIKLALNKNVMIESGGITWLYNSEFYPYKGAVTAVKEASDMVGVHKLMWGSDYPRTMTAITYKMSYDFFIKNEILTQEEKIKFLGENAVSFYGFTNVKLMEYIKNMVED